MGEEDDRCSLQSEVPARENRAGVGTESAKRGISDRHEHLGRMVEYGIAVVQHYAYAMEALDLGIVLFQLEDPEDELSLRIIGANKAVEPHAGYRPEELIGRTLIDVFPEIAQTGLPRVYADVALSGMPKQFPPFYYDHNRRMPDSWWSIRAFPIPENNVGIVFENVTERVRLEERTRQINRELEERFSTIFESADVGMVIADAEGRLLLTNPSFQRLLGYTEDELVGITFTEITHPDDQAGNLEPFNEMIAETRDGYHTEKRYITKSGSIVWANIVVSPLRHGEEGFRCVAMVQDITQRKRVELALQESEQESRQLAEERSSLADIGRIISSSLDIHEIYEQFADRVKTLIPFDRLAVGLHDSERGMGIIAYEFGLPSHLHEGSSWTLTGTLASEAIQSGSPVLFTCEDEDEVARQYPGELNDFHGGTQSFVCVPLLSREEVIGSIYFKSHCSQRVR